MATETQHGSYADDSTVVGVAREIDHRLRAWIAASRLARTARTATDTLEAAADSSALTASLTTLAAWTRASFLYRWLTKEPEPEVIVIDLRETYTVGPIIAVLDRLVPLLARAWDASGVGHASARTAAAVRDAPVRAVSVVVLAAVLANTLLTATTSTLSQPALLARVAVLAAALAGTRVRTSWQTLAQSRTIQLLKAALEPPELPEDERRE